jgi:hypothetical protein
MALRRSGRQLTKQCEAQVEGGDGAARSLRQNVPMEHLRALERAHVCERHAYQFQGHKVGWLEAQRLCSNATKRQVSGVRCQVSGVRRQASGVRRQASGVRRQASGVRRQASGVRHERNQHGARTPCVHHHGGVGACTRTLMYVNFCADMLT